VSRSGTLYLVATPIGNLGDITKRAIEILSNCPVIVTEDTRTTGNLLNYLGIEGKKLISFYEGKEEKEIPHILSLLRRGIDIALVSEAGSPVISDPGYLLVKECIKEDVKVTCAPGPSAPIASLMISGIEPIPFTFLGFLPRRQGEIKNLFYSFLNIKTTLIFFERKSRLKNTLKLAFDVFGGEREVAIVRELTKLYEEVIRFPLYEYNKLNEVKGEITVIISPPKKDIKTDVSYVKKIIEQKIGSGLTGKDIIKEVMDEVIGWNKKEIYDLFLRIKNG